MPMETSLIEAIHAAPLRFVVAVTGGGSGAVAALLGVPGASRTVLEALVPYHERALLEFLGGRPEQFCSAATAQAMARRARERAAWLAPGEIVAGIGVTASLVSDRPKKGEHRCFIAVETAGHSTLLSLTLQKGGRDRAAEEGMVDIIILNAMAEAAGVADRLPVPLLPGEAVVRAAEAKTDLLEKLVQAELPALVVWPDGRVSAEGKPVALLPGAFNPAHAGHWSLAATAARRTGLAIGFELSAVNVDKPPLSAEELRRRLHPFAWAAPVWITRAPTFVEKARLFPGTVFVVGADTAERIVQARYYGDSVEQMHAALAEIRTLGCRFVVAGRRDEVGAFRCLERVQLGDELRTLFAEIPEQEFRFDGSSTEIRAARRSC
jgi:nicotinamide mononucleotide (NMN) deamidase PncC